MAGIPDEYMRLAALLDNRRDEEALHMPDEVMDLVDSVVEEIMENTAAARDAVLYTDDVAEALGDLIFRQATASHDANADQLRQNASDAVRELASSYEVLLYTTVEAVAAVVYAYGLQEAGDSEAAFPDLDSVLAHVVANGWEEFRAQVVPGLRRLVRRTGGHGQDGGVS